MAIGHPLPVAWCRLALIVTNKGFDTPMADSAAAPQQQFSFTHRERPFEILVTADGTLELYLDGILRKDRPRSERSPQYVWTNVELEWEEHHYVEVRYWASDNRLQVTINREPAHDLILGA